MRSISFTTVLIALVVLAVILLGISSAILRSLDRQTPVAKWPLLIDESLEKTDAPLRADMVERLAMIQSPWAREILARAKAEERDPHVCAAIDTALSH